MRKISLNPSDFWSNTGTLKGLAEMALALRREFLPARQCPPSLYDFFAMLIQQPSGRAFASKFMGSKEVMKDEVHQIHALMRWVDGGLSAFDLTHGLMSALLLTDPSDVSREVIRAPFPTFTVRFPDGFWQMHGNSGNATAASIGIVHHFEAMTSNMKGVQSMLSLRIVAKDGATSTWETLAALQGDGNVGAWLDEDVPVIEDPSGALVTPTENDQRISIAFRRLFVNLCLYVTAHGRGEPLGKRPQARGGGRGEPSSSPDVWVLGREVKLDRNLMDAAKAWTDSKSRRESAGEGWRLRERFTVRGHWRNQAHGPGRALRTLKWIAPHWKGEGPTFQHVYAPKGDQWPTS